MLERVGLGLIAVAVIGVSIFVSGEINDLQQTVDDQETELVSLREELDTTREDTANLTATDPTQEVEAELESLSTCFREVLAAVQSASVEGYIDNYDSGSVNGWIDLGRFSSDCGEYLEVQPAGD